jgi:hypothetical protein
MILKINIQKARNFSFPELNTDPVFKLNIEQEVVYDIENKTYYFL